MLTRRHLLAAVMPLVLTGPSSVLASPEGRIETLFHQWREAYTAFELGWHDSNQDRQNWSRLKEIEAELFEIQPTTMRELAIKVLVAFNYDSEDGCPNVNCDLVFDAETIVGMPKPYGYSDYTRDLEAGGTA